MDENLITHNKIINMEEAKRIYYSRGEWTR